MTSRPSGATPPGCATPSRATSAAYHDFTGKPSGAMDDHVARAGRAARAARVVVAVTDFSSIETGCTLVMVLAGLGSLPDLVRLVTGRLHRWRVVAGDAGIRYRGYHTERSLAWNEISSIRAQATPPGVTVEAKDGTPALLVPALPFDVHPDAIAEALNQRRTRSLRR